MHLTAADSAELAYGLPLAIELEPYRERLSPVAIAVLQGESRRTIDKRRALVLPDVWDGKLRVAVKEGIARLRTELERKLAVLERAEADVDLPARDSKLARHVVDRVLAELLDNNDENIATLEALEQELELLPPSERPARAAVAARGAFVAAAIPPNELRAATVRAARAVGRDPIDRHDAFERGAITLARALATDKRRAAARTWVENLADASNAHAPLLSESLLVLAGESARARPADDLIWIQACLGLTFASALGDS